MLAKLYDHPFDGRDWIYEIKWDGYRAIAECNGKDIKLYSRNGLSFEIDYPSVFDELKKLNKKVILDGEIVALNDEGLPKFQLLQQYAQDNSPHLVYYVFDILVKDGKSVMNLPLLERKQLLREVLPADNDHIVYADHIEEKGIAFFEMMKQRDLEGMIAKRADSVYVENSRNGDWLKVKNVLEEDYLICGYTKPQGGRKHFGALVLGTLEKGTLKYVGHTGTGFTDKALSYLHDMMQPLRVDSSPFPIKINMPPGVTWVKPELVAKIKFAEMTGDGILRHAVFLGLRKDAPDA